MPNFFRLKVMLIFAAKLRKLTVIFSVRIQINFANVPVQAIILPTVIEVKISRISIAFIARVETDAGIVNSGVGSIGGVTRRAVRYKYSVAPIFISLTVETAVNRTTVIFAVISKVAKAFREINPNIFIGRICAACDNSFRRGILLQDYRGLNVITAGEFSLLNTAQVARINQILYGVGQKILHTAARFVEPRRN